MLLLDEHLSRRLVPRLEPLFPGTQSVELVAELGPAATDRAIWQYAKSHRLAIVTKDKDFVDLMARWGHPPKVVRLTIGNARVQALEDHIRHNRGRITEFLIDPSKGLLTVWLDAWPTASCVMHRGLIASFARLRQSDTLLAEIAAQQHRHDGLSRRPKALGQRPSG